MTKLEKRVLLNVCDEHNQPNVVGAICGSVLRWKCKKCKKVQKTNPHYAEHQKYVCERCQNK